MPDITMCMGGDCPMKANCYRYRAVATPHRQSYFLQVPCDYNSDTIVDCDYFWDIKKRTDLEPLPVDGTEDS